MELLGKNKEELRAFCQSLGEPAYRGAQLYHALYAERRLNVADMTNLPAALRTKLSSSATVTLPSVKHKYLSTDGSVRYLFGLPAPQEQTRMKVAAVEAVFMPSEGRQTICISTQAGCAVDCQFCLTAQLGLIRNLNPGEILAQVLLPLNEMGGANSNGESAGAGEDALAARTNVVLMGQGEPLLNFENTFAAVRILLDKEGVGLSPKHVTLSTSGVIPGIDRMAKEEVRPKLAIPLNASNDEQRDVLMPLNKKYPLKDLLAACRRYPLRNWEHITFEYVMLKGVNDSPAEARALVRLLKGLPAKINLIPFNPWPGSGFECSDWETIERFSEIVFNAGYASPVRTPRGRDILAACGQLKSESEKLRARARMMLEESLAVGQD